MAIVAGLIIALVKWRDRLFARLGANAPARESVSIAPGVRIVIVDVSGKRLACALNREGVTAMQVLGDSAPEGAKS
jgi:hypothetical protein